VSERPIFYFDLQPDWEPFTFGNPLEVAWEVTPFSFIVDWGFNVGDTLSSLDALKGVDNIRGTVTRKRWATVVDRYTPSTKPDLVQAGITKYESHQRAFWNTIPLPPLPSWKPSFSWHRIRNGISLLTVLNDKCP
jgi:hypothetical protein